MQIEATVDSARGWIETLTLNGEKGHKMALGGVRIKYKFPEQGLIGMVCGMGQCEQEARTWHNLKPDHRSVFMPCLGGGEIDLVPRPKDGYKRKFDVIVKPWYSGLMNARDEQQHVVFEEYRSLHESLTALVKSYGIGDWDSRQWKMSPSGLPIIHDYGIHGPDPSKYEMPEWWQEITLDNWWVKA